MLATMDEEAYVDLINAGVRAMLHEKDTASAVEAVIALAEPAIIAAERARIHSQVINLLGGVAVRRNWVLDVINDMPRP